MTDDVAGSLGPTRRARSTEAVLREVEDRVEEFRTLDPAALRLSPGFRASEKLEVLPEHRERRERVQRAYSALLKVHGCMLGPQNNYVAYYYEDEDGKKVTAATKWQKIESILAECPIGDKHCAVLADAFGFEFEDKRAILRRWCDTVKKLEEANLLTP